MIKKLVKNIDARDVHFYGGTAMLAAGAWFIYEPAALIAAGLVFLYVSIGRG